MNELSEEMMTNALKAVLMQSAKEANEYLLFEEAMELYMQELTE
jgi:hypothetical protein